MAESGMLSVLSCAEDGQTAGSSKESGTTSCFLFGVGLAQVPEELKRNGSKCQKLEKL